jgi:ATP-dependent Lon protease
MHDENENVSDTASSNTELVLQTNALPDTIHLLPVSNRPFFPAQIHPVVIQADIWEKTVVEVSQTEHKLIGLCYVEHESETLASPDHFPKTGCIARMINPVRDEERIQFIAQGIARFSIVRWLHRSPPFLVQVEYPQPDKENRHDTDTLRAYSMALISTLKELIPLNPLYNEALKFFLSNFSPNDPAPLTDFAAAMTTASGAELQSVLETWDLPRRMEKVLVLLKKELEIAKLQSQISEEVNQKISKRQREFFLREQLKVIQKELGISKDDKTAEVDQFKERLAHLTVPPAVQERIDEEMQKLAILELGSPEYGVTRNYLDWLTMVPWGVYSKDILDLKRARKILDKGHDGLDDVKDRIIEFLAVGVFKGEISGSILLLIGPPGVGKSSIGKGIADALGRKFYRFSVGGMRDEAEIKGHRRTYIGAMPGKLVQALKEVKVANPVIMLDEIDKIGTSWHGDPASALLEVLDPEQNQDFLDHYLDVRVDLSKVLFICTANQLDTIPRPLLDRMDMIRLSGYITEEKVSIAKHHLWPRQLEHAGVPAQRLRITTQAIRNIIEGYARESGVRNLEKQLNRIVRKSVITLLDHPDQSLKIDPKTVSELLGQPAFSKERPMRGIGIVTGLAWTALGGATLPVEATLIHTKNRGFKLTGKLGEVMRESAEIAYSYISAHLKTYQGRADFFDNAYIHLHVPEGATPKDGPSAGVTMATALLSLARGEKVARKLAMTGELTLTGVVLPVGGIREKLIAARRAGIYELIFPEANRKEYDELPDYLKKGMTLHFANRFSDIFETVFSKTGSQT